MQRLSFKWGTINGWRDLSPTSREILSRYWGDLVPMSSMYDTPNEARRAILCELIDQFDGEIENDWSGKRMTKKEAKDYVMNY